MAYNDCKLAYYKANGATSNGIQDAEHEFLLAHVATTIGANQDMWLDVFDSLGYPNSYPDGRDQFWIDNGCAR